VNDPFVTRVVKTAKRIYGLKPVIWPTAAGTGPLYVIRNWLGIPVVSAGGAGYPGSRIHAPNENIRLKDYIRSIKYMVALINSYEE